MCHTIVEADFLREKDGTAPTAKEIFHYSPRGELAMIFEWYEVALIMKGQREKLRETLLTMMKDYPDTGIEDRIKRL
jgi:hypothetical protein